MKKVQKPRKPLIVYYLIALGVLIVINFIVFPMMMNGNIEGVDYGTFLTMVEEKQVSKVQLEGETIYFTDKSIPLWKTLSRQFPRTASRRPLLF